MYIRLVWAQTQILAAMCMETTREILTIKKDVALVR
jgi:hypothetical protein